LKGAALTGHINVLAAQGCMSMVKKSFSQNVKLALEIYSDDKGKAIESDKNE